MQTSSIGKIMRLGGSVTLAGLLLASCAAPPVTSNPPEGPTIVKETVIVEITNTPESPAAPTLTSAPASTATLASTLTPAPSSTPMPPDTPIPPTALPTATSTIVIPKTGELAYNSIEGLPVQCNPGTLVYYSNHFMPQFNGDGSISANRNQTIGTGLSVVCLAPDNSFVKFDMWAKPSEYNQKNIEVYPRGDVNGNMHGVQICLDDICVPTSNYFSFNSAVHLPADKQPFFPHKSQYAKMNEILTYVPAGPVPTSTSPATAFTYTKIEGMPVQCSTGDLVYYSNTNAPLVAQDGSISPNPNETIGTGLSVVCRAPDKALVRFDAWAKPDEYHQNDLEVYPRGDANGNMHGVTLRLPNGLYVPSSAFFSFNSVTHMGKPFFPVTTNMPPAQPQEYFTP